NAALHATAMPVSGTSLSQSEGASFRASGQRSSRCVKARFQAVGRHARPGAVARIPENSRNHGRLKGQASALAPGADDRASLLARALLLDGRVDPQKIIAVRHLKAGGRLIPVHFSRNDGGAVAGRAILGAPDTPMLAGP